MATASSPCRRGVSDDADDDADFFSDFFSLSMTKASGSDMVSRKL